MTMMKLLQKARIEQQLMSL